MKLTMRNALLALIFLSLAISTSTFCLPLPQGSAQGNSQSPTPPSRPAQAQVMLAPAPILMSQLPPADPLPADARKPDQLLRVGHTQSVQALAFSPDGRRLASGGYDQSIIVWNLSSGREEFHLGGLPAPLAASSQSLNKQAISWLTFSSDGTRLVAVNVSGVIRVWNLQARKLLFAINPHRVHYYGGSVTFSADGKSLIVAAEKRVKDATETAIAFYDAESGKSLRTIPTKWNVLSLIVPTADGRLIAAGTVGADDDDDPNGSVEILDAASGEVQKTFPVVASSISPDGRWMASFDNAGTYHPVLWNLNDGKRAHDLTVQNASHVVFRPDGQEVAITHGDSKAIDFVSTSTGKLTKSLPGGDYGLATAVYSADGKFLAAGSYSYGTIKVWDLASIREQVTLYGQSPVQSVTFSPEGKMLAATSGELRVWDVSNGKEIVTLTDSAVNRAAFSADGKWLAANPSERFPGKTVKIWNTASWKEETSFTPENGFPAFWFAFSDAKAAPRKIGNVWSWQFASGGETKILWASSAAMAISSDGKWLAQPAGASGTVEIWDARTEQKLQSIPAHRLAVGKLAFSHNGRWLVTVGQENNPMMVQGQPGVMISPFTVTIWDTGTWKKEFAFPFIAGGGPGVDISADGKLLAVTKGGGSTQIFDLEQKRPLAVLASTDAWPGNLAISPDGTVLVQGAQEGIRLWKLPAKVGSN